MNQLEYDSQNAKQPVTDLPVAKQWFKFVSTVVVVVTGLPRGSGISFGMSS